MALDILELALIDFLGPRVVPALISIGDGEPQSSAETPALAFSYDEVLIGGSGLGRNASGTLTGALATTAELDLANPRLVFADDSVELLSGDRRELTVAHGPLVTADGAADLALAAADFKVALNGSALGLVAANPVAGQFAVDGGAGKVTFGTPLPPTGTLVLNYFVGQWDVETIRLGGKLGVHVFGQSSAEVRALTNSVFSLLRANNVNGLRRVSPAGMSTIQVLGEDSPSVQRRTLRFDFQFEHAAARLPTGGGLITRIEVESRLFGDDEAEQFVIEHP